MATVLGTPGGSSGWSHYAKPWREMQSDDPAEFTSAPITHNAAPRSDPNATPSRPGSSQKRPLPSPRRGQQRRGPAATALSAIAAAGRRGPSYRGPAGYPWPRPAGTAAPQGRGGGQRLGHFRHVADIEVVGLARLDPVSLVQQLRDLLNRPRNFRGGGGPCQDLVHVGEAHRLWRVGRLQR